MLTRVNFPAQRPRRVRSITAFAANMNIGVDVEDALAFAEGTDV